MIHRLFAALSVLVCATANAKTIEGQVFIVTAGGPAIKLALVQVKAISKIEIENHIAKVEQQIASERDEVNAAAARDDEEFNALMEDMRAETARMTKMQKSSKSLDSLHAAH